MAQVYATCNTRGLRQARSSCGRRAWLLKYSRYTEVLPTRAFLVPLDEDEEIEVVLGKGQSVNVKYKACGELQPDGKRCVCCARLEDYDQG